MTGIDSNSESLNTIEPLLSVDEVAELLRISESGVYRLISRGELTRVKVGGRTRFEPAALRAFIAARRESADSQVPQAHEEAA